MIVRRRGKIQATAHKLLQPFCWLNQIIQSFLFPVPGNSTLFMIRVFIIRLVFITTFSKFFFGSD